MRRAAIFTVVVGCLGGCSLLYGGGLVAGDDEPADATADTVADTNVTDTFVADTYVADTFVADTATMLADSKADTGHFFCTGDCAPGNYCCYMFEGKVCSATKCDGDAGNFMMQLSCESNLDCPNPSDICCVTETWSNDAPKVSVCQPGGSMCLGWILCFNGGSCPSERPHCNSDSKWPHDLKAVGYKECEPDALP